MGGTPKSKKHSPRKAKALQKAKSAPKSKSTHLEKAKSASRMGGTPSINQVIKPRASGL
jgi:hypothetical protein